MKSQSLWRDRAVPPLPSKPLPKEVDVVVIGAGITGLTTALFLKRAGKRVAVFDREAAGSGETGNTSAHLTYVTDVLFGDIAKRFGTEAATLVWQGGRLALDIIESTATQHGIDCGFRRVPGYLCVPFFEGRTSSESHEQLRSEAAAITDNGFDARLTEDGPLTGGAAIRFADQAIVHPINYLAGLAKLVDSDGSVVRYQAEVGSVVDDPLAVIVDGENVACTDIVVATHVPVVGIRNLAGATLFQTKLYPYSSYVLGERIDTSIAPGLYFDTTDPYYYLRVHDDAEGRYAIFGGEDHKTGQETDTASRFAKLTEAFLRLVPSAKIDHQWSGQVIETDDDLPFIGEVAPHQYAATGYAGNGLTFGTLAGLMMHDAILGRPNAWRDIFDPRRKASSFAAVKRFVAENFDYPKYLIADRFRAADGSGIENVPRGGGKILSLDGQRVAVHRRDNGDVIKVSATCTHMGCLVRWNDAERTWDCPCHGSRFTVDGLVLGGPAEAPLEKID